MMRMQRWGVTGWSDAWKTLGSDVPDDDESAPASLDGYGFERTVDPSVVYLPPTADIAGVPRWHVKAGSGGRILQMSWPEDTSCRVGTWRDGSPYVSLPDVGFAWDKRAGLMIPNWIAEPDLEMLFGDGAERRNDSCFAEIADASASGRDDSKRAAERAASELADVRLLARLVAVSLVGSDEVRRWCGGKNTLMRLPSKDVAPDTHARIWDEVIAPALGGQIRTCDELRVRLAANRPSSHFLHVPPAPPWAGWAVLRRAAVVGLAAATLGLLWVCFDFVKPFIFPPRAPFCSAVPKSDPLYEKLVGLKAEHAAFKACGRDDCLDPVVEDWLLQAEEEGRAVRERLRSRPQPTAEEVRGLKQAVAAIHEVELQAKRQGSSTVVPLLVRELKLRGGELPTAHVEKTDPE